MVVVIDCEFGNKKVFEMIVESRVKGILDLRFIFICFLDVVYVGKSLKCNFVNWMLLLRNERVCLFMIYIIRNVDFYFKKILLRDSVFNKDRMDVDCVLYLSKGNVLAYLENIDYVVYLIVFDSYKIFETNKIGMFFYLIVVCVGEYGKIFVFDYVLVKNFLRLLEVRLYVFVDVKILGEYLGVLFMVYFGGIAYFC